MLNKGRKRKTVKHYHEALRLAIRADGRLTGGIRSRARAASLVPNHAFRASGRRRQLRSPTAWPVPPQTVTSLSAVPPGRLRMNEMAHRAAMKMKKAAYKRALEVVGSVVLEWDPYGLIAGGAPADEFDSEIAGVVTQIPRIKTEKAEALALSRVFSSAFEEERFTPDECTEAGKKLFAALAANGFVG